MHNDEDDDFGGDIAGLEARIERLSESIERCRKLSFAAKLAIAAGAAWIALTLLWVVPYVPFELLIAVSAVIGGIVLLGSNASTWTQLEASRRAAEEQRAELIGTLELRVVDEGVRRLH
jgi:hypothetical protein